MAEGVYERIVFLNHLVSLNKSRSSHKEQAPTWSAYDLLSIIEKRYKSGFAIEFFGAEDDDDDRVRIEKGIKHNFIRIKFMQIFDLAQHRYAIMFFEFGNHKNKTLSVVHATSFVGRELEGEAQEVGASCAHVLVRMPLVTDYDDGKYRCVIEYVNSGVSRGQVEYLLRRQLRRWASAQSLTFTFIDHSRGKKPKEVEHRYHPSLELVANIGRKMGAFGGQKILTSLAFIKRSERLSTGASTDVEHTSFEADVDIRVSAAQAPEDPEEKRGWVTAIRKKYEELGYKTKLYYRSAGGSTLKGDASAEVAGMADLLLCPREIIYLDEPQKRWRAKPEKKLLGKLYELVNKDEIWEAAE